MTSPSSSDSNPSNCRRAEEAGFQVIYGDALQERTLQRARFENVGSAIGLTPNQMLNSIFASRAREKFGVPRGYVAASNPEAGLAPELVEREEVVVLFDGPHDVERWDVRSRHGELEVEAWVFGGEPERDVRGDEEAPAAPTAGERFVILSIQRGKKTMPMHAGLSLEAGDIAAVAIHRDERETAQEILTAWGWAPQEPSASPEEG